MKLFFVPLFILLLCLTGCSLFPKIIPDELGGNHNKKLSVNAMAQQGSNALSNEKSGDRTGSALFEPKEGLVWVYYSSPAKNNRINVYYNSHDKSIFGYGFAVLVWLIIGAVLVVYIILAWLKFRRKP